MRINIFKKRFKIWQVNVSETHDCFDNFDHFAKNCE